MRREGGFDGGPAAQDRAVVAFVFALFGPEGGDGLGVTFLESDGEVARRLEDGLSVGVARRAFGDRSILELRLACDPEAGAEQAADGGEAKNKFRMVSLPSWWPAKPTNAA
jgi:hypothetical protein